jgi:hypothetical protein
MGGWPLTRGTPIRFGYLKDGLKLVLHSLVDSRTQLLGQFFNSLEFLIQVLGQEPLGSLVYSGWDGLGQVCEFIRVLHQLCQIGTLRLERWRGNSFVELRRCLSSLCLTSGSHALGQEQWNEKQEGKQKNSGFHGETSIAVPVALHSTPVRLRPKWVFALSLLSF